MPTFNLLPDSLISNTGWNNPSGGPGTHLNVDEDNGDTDYIESSTNGNRFVCGFQDPPIAEGVVDSITSVVWIGSMAKTSPGNSLATARLGGTLASGGSVSTGLDNITVTSGGSYATQLGEVEIYSTGTTSWVYGDLAGLQWRIDKARTDRFGELRVSYIYLYVTYVEAEVTENAIFFGSNF